MNNEKMNNEKKWHYYKHTKPCFAVISGQECMNKPCNYAHTLEQYLKAIEKHKFKVDNSIIFQFENPPPPAKKRCFG